MAIESIKLLRRLSDLSPEAPSLSLAIWSLGKLAEAGLLRSLKSVQITPHLAYMLNRLGHIPHDNQAVAVTLLGLGRLAEMALFESIAATTVETLLTPFITPLINQESISAQHAGNTMWGLKILAMGKLLPCETAKTWIQKLYRIMDTSDLFNSDGLCTQVIQSLSFCDEPIPDTLKAKTIKKTFSRMHRDVSLELTHLQLPHEDEYVLGGYAVDIFLTRARCIIEIDGAFFHHEARRKRDEFRDRWFTEKFGYPIIRIPTEDNMSLEDVIQNIIQQLGNLPPDISNEGNSAALFGGKRYLLERSEEEAPIPKASRLTPR
jgi:very-short-patch-repair endonuclease